MAFVCRGRRVLNDACRGVCTRQWIFVSREGIAGGGEKGGRGGHVYLFITQPGGFRAWVARVYLYCYVDPFVCFSLFLITWVSAVLLWRGGMYCTARPCRPPRCRRYTVRCSSDLFFFSCAVSFLCFVLFEGGGGVCRGSSCWNLGVSLFASWCIFRKDCLRGACLALCVLYLSPFRIH